MNAVNPKWERDFLVATLALKTLEMELQEKWNSGRQGQPQKPPASPTQGKVNYGKEKPNVSV